MSQQNAHPKWWQLYLTLPLLMGLFAVDSHLKLSVRGHQIVQIGIILFGYGLVHLWLKANSLALSNMDRRDLGKVTIVRVASHPLPDSDHKEQMFNLSDLEIKGVLENTFEMDIIDAEILPMEEAPQELNKE